MAFQVGDLVEYNGHIAEVIELDREVPNTNGLRGALVEWSNKKLVPSQMIVPYTSLLYVGTTNNPKPLGSWMADLLEDTKSINTDEKCPICGSKWIETWINKELLYDCKKCNSTKETIMENYIGDVTNLSKGLSVDFTGKTKKPGLY